MGLLSKHSLGTWLAIIAACLVAAWAGYLAGAQRSFGRLPYYTIGQVIAESSPLVTFAGWSFAEPPFRWSEGRGVSIALRPRNVPPVPLVLDIDIALAAGPQTVTISLNGSKLGTIEVPESGGRFSVDLPAGALRALADNVIGFEIPNPRSPGASDPRMLGIALRGLRVREA